MLSNPTSSAASKSSSTRGYFQQGTILNEYYLSFDAVPTTTTSTSISLQMMVMTMGPFEYHPFPLKELPSRQLPEWFTLERTTPARTPAGISSLRSSAANEELIQSLMIRSGVGGRIREWFQVEGNALSVRSLLLTTPLYPYIIYPLAVYIYETLCTASLQQILNPPSLLAVEIVIREYQRPNAKRSSFSLMDEYLFLQLIQEIFTTTMALNRKLYDSDIQRNEN